MQMLGKGLKDLPRDQIVLATKFGRYGPNLFDFSAERVRGVQQSSHVTHRTAFANIVHGHSAVHCGSITLWFKSTLYCFTCCTRRRSAHDACTM